MRRFLMIVKKVKKDYAPKEYKQGWRFVVWVGGCDDYYTEYERAKEHYDEWIEKGYDDVHLMEVTDE
tara:strand:- start:284 stop:484 length:201 start_codon:yes stop_codon:yes gene_type:complete